jgi:hydrogenase/urease accessory protein HupE
MRLMKWRLLVWIVLVAVLIGNSTLASAHALQPGYLELSLGGEQQYDVVWKVPMVRGQPMAIAAVLPENCNPRKATAPIWDGVAYIARWTTRCNGGLEGGLVEIDGLGRTTTDVLVRFEFANGVSESRRLTAESPSFTIPGQPSRLEVVQTYLSLGLDHILTGVDHLLFVLALLLLLQDLRSLIITITAFTIAHSLTLAGATLGWVQVPGPPVEAVIALSIVFVASRIVGHSAEKPDLMARYPWSIAFTFGLLHGFGFAGALAEIGLPQDSIPMALLFFNLGIELGQLLFVLFCVGLFAIVRTITRGRDQFPSAWGRAVSAYAIGSLAIFWVIERVASFWTM